MEQFAPYGHAIAAVVIFAMLAQILNAMTGIKKGSLNMQPGEQYKADYKNKAYRLDRTYMSTVETLAFFAPLVGAAILAGANLFWTNVFASLGMLLRLVANVLYMRSVGPGYGGIRTMTIIGLSACNLGLAVLAIYAVLAT